MVKINIHQKSILILNNTWRSVHCFLGSSRSVNGGHQTLQNSEVVIDDFANRSQAIGGAASITDLKKEVNFNNFHV